MFTFLKLTVTYFAWPVILMAGLIFTAYGFTIGQPLLYFNIAYISSAVIILLLERTFPFEKEWLKSDGQLAANIGHTLSSKGIIQAVVIFSSVIGIADLLEPYWETGYGIWPTHWPLFFQVVLGLAAAEFGLYWAHRLSHEHDILWGMHAIHHSVKKLWVMNTGSFHFLDSLFKIIAAMGILLALGAPLVIVQWLSVVTAFIGILTHCNIDVKTGFLSYIFNTPNLHRWHHSRDIREGNKNYGENLVIWDLLFGTWFNPSRRPPANIGINEYMPDRFKDQILYPLKRKLYRDMPSSEG